MGDSILMSQYFINIYKGIKALLGGMSLTLKHMNNKKDLVATMQYPHEKWPMPEKNIGFENSEYNLIRSRLHVDIDDCIGCLQCERACPVDCIKIDTIKPPKDNDYDCGKTTFGTQKKMIVPRFTIDMSECMYCNLCVYPCPEECIYMVGGPNDEKHPIDYEFSKYDRDGLIFEFANSTDQDIIDVGGEDYLNKRKAKQKNLADGLQLKGKIETKEDPKKVAKKEVSNKAVAAASSKPDIKSLNVIEDKMTRAIAKKAFLAASKVSEDVDKILSDVALALKESDKMNENIESIFNNIKSSLNKASLETSQESTSSFTIKSFNSITDKMARGVCKKIFLMANKTNTPFTAIAKQLTKELKAKELLTDEVKSVIKEMVLSISKAPKAASSGLFDIKSLNEIDDKMTRGLAKKIYIAGKKADKTSKEVVVDILGELEKNDKITDDIKNLLNGLSQ